MERSRTKTFEHTIAGLITKRADLFQESERLHDQLAVISNDIAAIDRVLGTLGYTGELDSQMPRRREVLYGMGELSRAILDTLRTAQEPLSCREIARIILIANSQDPEDQSLLADHARRVSRTMWWIKKRGLAQASKDRANKIVWMRSIFDDKSSQDFIPSTI